MSDLIKGSVWGNVHEQAARGQLITAPDPAPHGLPPTRMEAMLDRMDRMVPRSVAGRVGARNRADEFFKKMLPPGASLSPNAGMGLYGAEKSHSRQAQFGQGGYGTQPGNGNYTSLSMPYLPEFASQDRQSYPTHRCLVRGTKVSYASGRVGPIEEVEVGDELLGPDGLPRRVLDVWSDGSPSELYEIEWSNGRKVRCTADHVWPTADGDIRTDQLRRGVRGLLARRSPRGASIGQARARLAGYFAAEGNILRNASNGEPYGVRFSLHIDEEWLDHDIRRCLTEAFDPVQGGEAVHDGAKFSRADIAAGLRIGRLEVTSDRYLVGTNAYADTRCDCGRERAYLLSTLCSGRTDSCGCRIGFTSDLDPQSNSRYLRASSLRNKRDDAAAKEAARWLIEHVGEGSDTKALSSLLMSMPLAEKVEFLIGYFRGDGSKRLKPSTNPASPDSLGREVSYVTTSSQLGWQVALIAAQCGFPGRIHETSSARGRDGVLRQAKVTGTFGGELAGGLSALVWPGSDVAEHVPEVAVQRIQMDEEFAYPTVRRIEKIEGGEQVFDLTVSDDHLYCLAGGLVTHNSLANNYWRMFYKLDPVIGNCIDMLADMIWSDLELVDVDGEVRERLEYMVERTQLRMMLPYLVREFLVLGEACPHLIWDEDSGTWSFIGMHDPDQLNIIQLPVLGHEEPIAQFMPDPRMRAVLSSPHPALQRVRDSMPPEVLMALQSGQPIDLSPINFTFIPRKLHPYEVRGTSLISRMWRILMYEDAVFDASIATARRHAGPIKVAKLGDPATGYVPDPSVQSELHDLLAQAEMDPNAWLVWHYGINFDYVGTTDRIINIRDHYDLIERVKLVALGISKAFLHGEVTYASAASGLTVFLQRLRAMREFFVSAWIQPKFFDQVSEMNMWIERPQVDQEYMKSGKGPAILPRRTAQEWKERKRLITPRIVWERSLDPEIDQAKLNAIQSLEQMGAKFSEQTKFALVGENWEEQLEQRIHEAQVKQQVAAANPGIAVLAPSAPEGGGMGGGLGGGGMPPMPGGDMPPPMDDTGMDAPPMVEPEAEKETGVHAEEGDETGGPSGTDDNMVRDLATLLDGEEPVSDTWYRMYEDAQRGIPPVEHLLSDVKAGDMRSAWNAVREWLFDEGAPEQLIVDLKNRLISTGALPKELDSRSAERLLRAAESPEWGDSKRFDAGSTLFTGFPSPRKS